MPPVPPTPPAIVSPAPTPRSAPWIAAPRPWGQARWLAQHEAFVARAREGGIDVLFLGDSIAAFFPTRGADVWQRYIAPLGAVADFGIEGDRTQFVLWRVQNGELDGPNARVIVLLVGTNNLATATPTAVARGIAAIVATAREKVPNATVILSAILPRGLPGDPVRAKIEQVNAQIAPLADGAHVRWLDAGAAFVDPTGAIDPALMPDMLHPSAAGYGVWTTALRPLLRAALER